MSRDDLPFIVLASSGAGLLLGQWLADHGLSRIVPDAAWSGIVAALAALGGVLISNASSERRQRQQIEHEERERARDRSNELRRQVYLEAAEQVSRAVSALSELPSKDPTNLASGSVVGGLLAAAAKLQVVAEPGTVVLVNEYMMAFANVLMNVLLRAIPVRTARGEIDVHHSFYQRAEAEVTRILEARGRLLEAPAHDPAEFAALTDSLERAMRAVGEFAEKRRRAWDVFNRANFEFQQALLNDTAALNERQLSLSLAIRGDLGLASDEVRLRQVLASSGQLAREQMERIRAAVHAGSSAPAGSGPQGDSAG